MGVKSGGNVGVRNANPSQRLVVGNNHFTVSSLGSVGVAMGNPTGKFQVGEYDFKVYDNGNVSVGADGPYGRLHVDAGEDWGVVVSGAAESEKAMLYTRINGVPNSAAVTGTRAIAVDVVNGGAFTPVFEIKGNGNTFVNGNLGVGAAATNDKLYINGNTFMQGRLRVNGKVCAQEVNVRLSMGSCPDYVFEPDYALRPLSEVRDYIAKNCHLPEIPSAAEAERDGLEVGDFQLKLLKKIEELTLYVIQLEKEIQEIKSK